MGENPRVYDVSVAYNTMTAADRVPHDRGDPGVVAAVMQAEAALQALTSAIYVANARYEIEQGEMRAERYRKLLMQLQSEA